MKDSIEIFLIAPVNITIKLPQMNTKYIFIGVKTVV